MNEQNRNTIIVGAISTDKITAANEVPGLLASVTRLTVEDVRPLICDCLTRGPVCGCDGNNGF